MNTSNAKQTPALSAGNNATVSGEPYYIQMDQLDVINGQNNRESFMQSPNDMHSTVNATDRNRTVQVGLQGAINSESLEVKDSEKATIETFKNQQETENYKREQFDGKDEDGTVAVVAEDQFFLTGVNVQNQDIQQYAAIMEKPTEIEEMTQDDQYAKEDAMAA